MPSATLHEAAASLLGAAAVRLGAPDDAIEGVVPRLVAEPATAEAVGAILEWASREKLGVLVRGSGTKLDWGSPPRQIDVLISTARLNAVVAHRHGDLTATIQAGATLGSVNRMLAQHRQWIPLDPPSVDYATIGGLVATNDSGPRRHRYGAPRDLIIGVEFARADGKLAKGGGIVVKNVAGYDLPRLMTGSFGSLGVIVAATFKLYPLTAVSRTLVVGCPTAADLGALAGRILSSPLTPTALEFATHPLRLLVRFESIEASVEQQCAIAETLIGESGFSVRAVAGSDEEALWNEHARFVAVDRCALLKVSALPADLAGTLELIDGVAGARGYAAAGRAGLGVFLLCILGDVPLQKRVIETLRNAQPLGRGSAVLVRGSAELKTLVDVWGPIGDGLPLMRAVKRELDPAGILSAGRGPGGL
ncbi:MAG TPA: FAD-binding oxidoreductase [Vicinamibacterales bacterium]|nr:FAD-binding oxidoreductase [Vicinamibacterales bacterium]